MFKAFVSDVAGAVGSAVGTIAGCLTGAIVGAATGAVTGYIAGDNAGRLLIDKVMPSPEKVIEAEVVPEPEPVAPKRRCKVATA